MKGKSVKSSYKLNSQTSFFIAGGGGRLEHALSEPLEAQPPVPERKEARSSQLRSQGVIQSLVLASFAAGEPCIRKCYFVLRFHRGASKRLNSLAFKV